MHISYIMSCVYIHVCCNKWKSQFKKRILVFVWLKICRNLSYIYVSLSVGKPISHIIFTLNLFEIYYAQASWNGRQNFDILKRKIIQSLSVCRGESALQCWLHLPTRFRYPQPRRQCERLHLSRGSLLSGGSCQRDQVWHRNLRTHWRTG